MPKISVVNPSTTESPTSQNRTQVHLNECAIVWVVACFVFTVWRSSQQFTTNKTRKLLKKTQLTLESALPQFLRSIWAESCLRLAPGLPQHFVCSANSFALRSDTGFNQLLLWNFFCEHHFELSMQLKNPGYGSFSVLLLENRHGGSPKFQDFVCWVKNGVDSCCSSHKTESESSSQNELRGPGGREGGENKVGVTGTNNQQEC